MKKGRLILLFMLCQYRESRVQRNRHRIDTAGITCRRPAFQCGNHSC